MAQHYQKDNILEIADGDQDFLKTLVRVFIEEVHQDLYSLEEAILNENRSLALRYTHKMQPNMETFGIHSTEDFEAIDEWSKATKSKTTILKNLQNLLDTLHSVFDELKADFKL